LTKVKDALNQETIYGYNEVGQQILRKDALGRETKYEYDKLRRRRTRGERICLGRDYSLLKICMIFLTFI
jgi:YD repeat-containing protein